MRENGKQLNSIFGVNSRKLILTGGKIAINFCMAKVNTEIYTNTNFSRDVNAEPARQNKFK